MSCRCYLFWLSLGWSVVCDFSFSCSYSLLLEVSVIWLALCKVRKTARVKNRYCQVSHLSQDTNWERTKITISTTNESQEVSSFPAGDHKAHINRRAQRHSKHKTEQKHKKIHKTSTALERSVNILLESLNRFHGANLTLNSDVDQDT